MPLSFTLCSIRTVPLFILLTLFTAGAVFAASTGSISRAQFTTQVKDKEPVDNVLSLPNVINTISFFSEIRNMEGKTVTHFWKYEGKLVSQKEFKVEGTRWRVYSEIALDPDKTGVWSVTVKNDQGWPLKMVIFKYLDSNISSSQTMILPADK